MLFRSLGGKGGAVHGAQNLANAMRTAQAVYRLGLRSGGKSSRMQLLSIAELLAGKQLLYPRMLDATFKKAPKVRPAVKEKDVPLAFDADEDEGPF